MLVEKYIIDNYGFMNMNYKDENGFTFLNCAVRYNCRKEIVQFLIIKGCNPNIPNVSFFNINFFLFQNIGNCPLHYALSYQNYEIANLLINSGANESLVNKNGLNPWRCINLNLDQDIDDVNKKK